MSEPANASVRCDAADSGTTATTVRRYDAGDMPRMTKTPEGFLKGEAQVTRTGVFRYRKADGSMQFELRHPDDVFHPDSLNSARLNPVVMNHPAGGKVNATNVKQMQIGMTGDGVRVDDNRVILPLAITDPDGVKTVESGKNQLSQGYDCTVVPERGTYDGQEYTHRQIDIRYNHTAIVDSARAGPENRIRLDSGDAELVNSPSNQGDTVMTEEERRALALLAAMGSIRLDGIEYKAPPEVVNALNKAIARADAADAELKTLRGQLATAQGRADGAEAELKKTKDGMGDLIRQAVVQRVTLLDSAAIVLGTELKPNDTDRAIMEAVILKASPGTKLDGQSDEYVRARFDIAVESAGDKNQARNRERANSPANGGGTQPTTSSRGDSAPPDAEAARKKYIEDLKSGK